MNVLLKTAIRYLIMLNAKYDIMLRSKKLKALLVGRGRGGAVTALSRYFGMIFLRL